MEEEDLKNELKQFSSLYSAHVIEDIPPRKKKQLLFKYEQESETDYEIMKISSLNCLSLINHTFENGDKAYSCCEMVLEVDPTNITALLNKANFLLADSRFSECQECLKQLKACSVDAMSTVKAKAEKAYVYFILGMSMYHSAKQIYEDVLIEVSGMDNVSENNDLVVFWRYRLAVLNRRLTNISNTLNIRYTSSSQDDYKTVLEQLIYLIRLQHTSPLINRYIRAQSYTELAMVLNNIKNQKKRFENGVLDILPDKELSQNDIAYFIEKELEIDGDNERVLSHCGMYYRNIKVEKSIELLKKSIEIKPTSFAHHQLALSLKRAVEIRNKTPLCVAPYKHQVLRKNVSKYASATEENCGAPKADTVPNMENGTEGREASKSNTVINLQRKLQLDSSERFCLEYQSQPSRNDNIVTHNDVSNELRQTVNNLFLVKSPKHPMFLSDIQMKEEEDILYHLEQSMIFSNNTNAIYDRGLFYRQLRREDEALGQFRLLMKDKDTSALRLAGAYEQAAYCLILMTQDGRVSNKDADIRIFLLKSIELSENVSKVFTHLSGAWQGLPTLAELLSTDQPYTKPCLKSLADIFKLLEHFDNSSQVLRYLQNQEKDRLKWANIQMEIINNSAKTGNYEEAIIGIQMLPKQNLSTQNMSRCIDIMVDGGMEATRKGEETTASCRFKQALNFKGSCCNNSQHVHGHEFDVYILCHSSEEPSEAVSNVKESLQQLGLDVNMRSDVVPGHDEIREILAKVKDSKHFIIENYDESQDTDQNDYLTGTIIKAKDCGNVVVLHSDERITLKLDTFPKFHINCFARSDEKRLQGHLVNLLKLLAKGENNIVL